jgi:HEPN domain-containing protein
MNRTDLQILAETRVLDATVLLDAGRWDAAYYLLGHAVECALKACIAKQFGYHEVPDKKLINDFYSHNLRELLRVAGLSSNHSQKTRSDPNFETNWTIVQDWSETKRYTIGVSEQDARVLLDAVVNIDSGVLNWLKTQW